MLDRALKNYDSWFPDFIEHDAKEELDELLRLEILVTTLHYAEVFAANLLAMKTKRKTYHRTLLEYPTSEIFRFYTGIKDKPLSYIAKLLGYPPLCRVSGNDENVAALKKSCVTVKKNLVEISDLFLTYNSVYNNYKHGFRLAIIGVGDPKNTELCVMSPMKGDAVNKASIMKLGSIEREIRLCGSMCKILHATTETFRLRILEEKQEFKVIAFEDRK